MTTMVSHLQSLLEGHLELAESLQSGLPDMGSAFISLERINVSLRRSRRSYCQRARSGSSPCVKIFRTLAMIFTPTRSSRS